MSKTQYRLNVVTHLKQPQKIILLKRTLKSFFPKFTGIVAILKNIMRSMDCTGLVADKFYILLTSRDTKCNKLRLPKQFCLKHIDKLQDSMELKLRNGYILPVQFDAVKCELKGVMWFFKELELEGGEILLFEYFGRFKFMVYIIGRCGSEITYPEKVHCLQRCSTKIVTLGDGGWRFIFFRSAGSGIFDDVDAPPAFSNCCGFALPTRITYVLRNGKKFFGTYKSKKCRFSGLNSMFEILGSDIVLDLRGIVFTYNGTREVSISAFDSHCNEIVYPGTPICMDSNGSFPVIGTYFQIILELKHVLDDCFVVDISKDFKELFEEWDNFQVINVYSESKCWRLVIRKRDDYHCATLEDGWQQLRADLGLIVGNTCVFESAIQCYDQFKIRVLDPEERSYRFFWLNVSRIIPYRRLMCIS
ncbi:hypothetical protein DCAR_0520612 [Daucus carota subsp. sativus]|uniref:Uncharacterized protein n=1 Tax=Daucus carota subsp. sativus TaxID=79200 RepID=A0A161YM83_DAUCS|nr:hypothetical protein DCAR_0520612 [Daucus carota subsp. sativus]